MELLNKKLLFLSLATIVMEWESTIQLDIIILKWAVSFI